MTFQPRKRAGKQLGAANSLGCQRMDARPWQIATLVVLHGEADRSHGHQQAVNAGGVNTHQTRQLPAANSAAAGDQILQTANAVDKALVRL
jgi:hypothetical protein